MSKKKPIELVTFDSPWTFDPGVVRVPLPAEAIGSDELLRRVYRNETTRPYIVENMSERRLHFTHMATQSVMSLDEPDALINDYTRKMMSFLLFNPNPGHILMIGLGGGSLAKFCYRHFPHVRITVVEIDADVIGLRDEFHVPQDDARFRVVHDDGARYLEQLADSVDVILVDAFDTQGIAPSLAASHFYLRAAKQLAENGVLAMNLWGEKSRYVANLAKARAAFGAHVSLVPVATAENVLLFASKQPAPQSVTGDLELLARRLERRLQLDFPRYLRRLCQGHLVDA